MTFQREFVRGEETVAVRVQHQGGDRYRVQIGKRTLDVSASALPGGGIRLAPASQDDRPPDAPRATDAFAVPGPDQTLQVRVDGRTWTLRQPGRRRGGGHGGADGTVRAPMTGTVTKVLCKPGDTVAADQTLIVLTAMKMEHKLTAGIAGVVESLAAKEGTTVEQGVVLAEVRGTENNQ